MSTPHNTLFASEVLGDAPPNPRAARRPLGGDTQILKRFGYITLSIHLFGVFRSVSSGVPLCIEVPAGASMVQVRQALKSAFKQSHPDFEADALVDESALANEQEILPEEMVFRQDTSLAILPPVCGG